MALNNIDRDTPMFANIYVLGNTHMQTYIVTAMFAINNI